MSYKFILYGLIAAAVTSCSSVYKASQTPDDVYYSPARDGGQKKIAKADRYEEYVSPEDDQYLRMKIRDRQRWSGLDDYSYWNDSRYMPLYGYGNSYYGNSLYNSYAWNNWNSPFSSFYYNPYYSGALGGGYMYGYNSPLYSYGYNPYSYGYGSTYIIKNPTRTVSQSVNRPNMNGYRNGLYNNQNSNSNQNINSTLRRVFAPSQNTNTYSNRNTNTYNSTERTYTPSAPAPSSSGSSGGSSGGISRPPR